MGPWDVTLVTYDFFPSIHMPDNAAIVITIFFIFSVVHSQVLPVTNIFPKDDFVYMLANLLPGSQVELQPGSFK